MPQRAGIAMQQIDILFVLEISETAGEVYHSIEFIREVDLPHVHLNKPSSQSLGGESFLGGMNEFARQVHADDVTAMMGQRLAQPAVTARAIEDISGYLRSAKPDLVIVQGDTTTAFVAALAAFYERIPVGHVEAGLRTGNKYSPFPEEINRRLVTHIADHHFAPTQTSRDNLLREGIPSDAIHVTGNTVIDALQIALKKAKKDPPEIAGLPPEIMRNGDGRPVVLITGHRRENFGDGFENICCAIKELAAGFPSVAFVYPVHLNPNVRKPVFQMLSGLNNVFLIEPLSYLPFVALMNRSTLVLTDSGGVQEEAPGLGKPVLVMRDTTERPEAVEAGTVKLVGTDASTLVKEVTQLLTNRPAYEAMARAVNPYGDGQACERIVEICGTQLFGRNRCN